MPETVAPKTHSERFKDMTDEEKQNVVNLTVDAALPSKVKDFKFNMHDIDDRLKPEGYEIPDTEKMNTNSVTYAETDYCSWYPKQPFINVEYQPAIIRSKFQLSLWKVDVYGCVKVKDNYISPENPKVDEKDFQGFKIGLSVDGNTFFLEEKGDASEEKLILLIDPFKLTITKEIQVRVKDPDFDMENIDDYYDNYYNDAYSKFATSSNIGRVVVCSSGKYIMACVTKPSKVVHYYYNIYDTETGEVCAKIERQGEKNPLYNTQIFGVKQSKDNPNNIFFTTQKEKDIQVVSASLSDGKLNVVSRNSKCEESSVRYVYLSESCKTVFVVASNYVNDQYVYILWSYGLNESPEINSQKGAKGLKTFNTASNGYVQGENFVLIENDERGNLNAHVTGKVNFKRASRSDKIVQYYEVTDCTQFSNNSVAVLSNLQDESVQIEIFPSEKTEYNLQQTIKEITMVQFYYPNVMIVKGGNEVLIYSIVDKDYYYLRLYAPLSVTSGTISTATNCEIKGLLDLGNYYTFSTMSFTTGSSPYFSGTFYKRYIEKENLPPERILNCFDVGKVKYLTKEEDSIIIQTAKTLFCQSCLSFDLFQVIESDYKLGELLHVAYTGFLVWKTTSKSVQYRAHPVNFNDRSGGVTMYESTDFLKVVKVAYNSTTYVNEVIICDEMKYIKQGSFKTDNNGKYQINIEKEYYVNNEFTGDSSNFVVSNQMLYEGFKAYLMQNRGKETMDLALTCEPDDVGIDRSFLAANYPIASKSWMMFFGKYYNDEKQKYMNRVLLLPEYNQPKIVHLNPNDVGYYKAEFFYYHNNDYLVYIKQTYGINHVPVEIFRRNGDFHQTIKLSIKGCMDYSYAKVILSPSGRYLMYIEGENVLGENNISEIKDRAIIAEIKHDPVSEEFVLETRRTVEDFKERYNRTASETNMYDYSSCYNYFLTDNMEILFVDTSDNKLMYEEIPIAKDIEKKLGRRDYNEEEYRQVADLTWIPQNGGFAAYSSQDVYFIRVNSETRSVLPIIKCNFNINKGQMSVTKLCGCVDPKLVIIALSKNTDNLLLVWDVEENREVYNFSTNKTWYYMMGAKSKAGYIKNGDTYVNLDKGLINYFFEYDFVNQGFYDQKGGFTINKNEELILEYGNIITKETIIEVNSVDDLNDEVTQINEENINLERVRFQVNGNTSLHVFALEYNTLSLILNYMEEHRPEYLTAILMKNNKGKSPLDISIDNESPKNTQLFLRKLTRFKDDSLSNLFYDRFNELLAMNINAFHEYLDSCVFQTIQMKATKYLKLKSDKDPWLVTHSSCLIDEVFIDKYCDTSEKKALEAEKKRKEEEDKKKEEEEKKKAENDANGGAGMLYSFYLLISLVNDQ